MLHGTTAPQRHRFVTLHALFPALVAALLLAAFAFAPPATPARAATDMVTNCNASGMGSLPAVLAAAGNGDTITFAQDCNGATAPNTTITLTATLIPAVNVTIDATVPPHMVTIGGNNTVQLFQVNNGVTLGLRGLTLTGGYAASNGGGALVVKGTGIANVSSCTFVNNAGATGGAIFNYNGGTLRVVNSTLTMNTAAGGGAILNSGGTLTVIGSTITGNSASQYPGGGIASSNAFTLTLSVVAGNTASITGPDIDNVVISGGGNVIGDITGTGGFIASDKQNTDPLLDAALANNGGTVQTFALQAMSPAIDILACTAVIDPTTGATLATDARGVSRPQPAGGNCDAGAYEALASPQTFTVTRTADDVNDAACNTAANGGCTLREAVKASNRTEGTATNTITFAVDAPTATPITLLAASGGRLVLGHSVTIDATAPLHTVTINGGGSVQLFGVNANATLGLRGLTLTGGNASDGGGSAVFVDSGGAATISGCTFTNNTTASSGGAIYVNNGTLQVTNSTFTNNTANAGGAINTL